MLSPGVITLIRDEQHRQGGRFIDVDDLDAYLAKLDARAELLSICVEDRCRGVVAFYGNDTATRRAFISLVLVHPDDRATGVGRTLVDAVLALVKRRGFEVCRLEVRKDNDAACHMYQAMGFVVVEDRSATHLMEIRL